MADINIYAELTEGAGFARWNRLFEDVIGGRLRWVSRDQLDQYRDSYKGLVDERVLFQGKPLISLSRTDTCRASIPFIDHSELYGVFLLDWQGDYKHQSAENAIQLFFDFLTSLVASLYVYDELEVAHTIWQRMLTITDVADLSRMILQEVLGLLLSKRGAIFLVDDDGNLTQTQAQTGRGDPVPVHDPELSISEYRTLLDNAIGVFINSEDPLAPWMRDNLNLKAEERCLVIKLAIGSVIVALIALPLATEKEPIEILNIADLDIIIEGGAACLNNAMNFERMRARQKALAIIHAVHRLMSICDGVGELLPRIAVQAANLLGTRKCSILRIDPNTGMLDPCGSTGLTEGELGTVPLRQGEGIPGWIVRNHNAAIIKNPTRDPRFQNEPEGRYLDQQYLSVPLIENYEIIGIMTVSDRERPFGPIDRDMLFALGEESVIAIRNAEAYDRQRAMTLNALRLIANLVETGDPDVPGNTEHVAVLSEQIGREMALPHREISCLRFAALLHDSGALGQPQADDESPHRHVRIGMRIAESIDVPDSVIPILEHHHEFFRGDGTPDGLSGSEIPFGSRIIAVADAFVALRKVHDEERALAVIDRLSGSRYDPDVVEALKRILQKKT